MSRIVPPLILAVAWALVPPPSLTGKEPTREERAQRRLAELRKLSDADLFARYDTAADDESYEARDEVTRENVLTEVVRRGGPSAEKWLRARMEADYERKLKEREVRDGLRARHEAVPKNEELAEEYRKSERTVRRLEDNLAIFTALRRVQQRPDPLTVTVTLPKDFVATTRKLPTLAVKITNTDPEQLPLWFQSGGDYRSGRLARWRIEAADEKRWPAPRRESPSFEGGGIVRQGTLAGGESWEGKLPMADFVRIPEPGEYTVRVLYHNQITIADEDGVAGLIVFRSKPFQLKVVRAPKQVIDLQPADRERARTALAALDEKGPVRIVIDDYGPEYHTFIPPTTPAGQLHDLGWRAVPTLLEALRDDKLTPGRRAWVIGLLHGIIREDELSPGDYSDDWDKVLGSYECQSPFGEGSSTGGKIDVERQKKLAARWLKFGADCVEAREAK